MLINDDIKLDYSDVLIRPKRSTMNSRSDVSLKRTHTFLHSKEEWTGIPIMAANMDTVGTFEMAVAIANHKLFTAIHKHYELDEWRSFIQGGGEEILEYVAVSTGTNSRDESRLSELMLEFPN